MLPGKTMNCHLGHDVAAVFDVGRLPLDSQSGSGLQIRLLRGSSDGFLTDAVIFAIFFFRSHLKKVFSSDIGVEPSIQVLNILKYACGLNLGLVFRLRLKATPDK
jgi:hypothetical protein